MNNKKLLMAMLLALPITANAQLNEDSSTQHLMLNFNNVQDLNMELVDFGKQYRQLACPGPYSLGKIKENRNYEIYKDLSNYTQALYGSWTETSRNCHRSVTLNQVAACPANQTGIHNQQRTYLEYYNGVITNDTGWTTVKNTCDYFYQTSANESRVLSCPVGQAGSLQEIRSYELWSDSKKRNFGAWTVTADNCKELASYALNQASIITAGSQSNTGNDLKCPATTNCIALTRHSHSPYSPYSAEFSLLASSMSAGTKAGLTIDGKSGQFVCVVNGNGDGGHGESNQAFIDNTYILPRNTSFALKLSSDRQDIDIVSCTLSNGATKAVIYGDCDTTSGGDADMCIGVTKTAEIKSINGCIATVRVSTANNLGGSSNSANVNVNLCL